VLADNYATAYQNYVNSTGIYQSAHNTYLTARSAYLASGSLESKSQAQTATLKMLQARDSLLVNYMTAISAKIQNSQGMLSDDKNSLTDPINSEISWYNSHNTKLASAGDLDDLVADSDEAKAQFTKSSNLSIYKSIIYLGTADNSYIRGEINGEINTLEAKIAEIKANQDKDVSSIERSLIDIKNKISRSQDKDNSARDAINAAASTSYGNNSQNAFNQALTAISDSNSYLKEANQSLLQIITQIKTN
jgi:hypothetical protein